MRDAVVLAFDNTFTPSTADRLGKTLTTCARMGICGGGMLVVRAATVLSLGAKSRLQRFVLNVVKLTRAAVEAVGKERRPVAGTSCHRQNDASRWVPPAALRRVSGILDVLVRRCRAGLPNVLGSFLKCLMIARMLVAGSLLVIGPSLGK